MKIYFNPGVLFYLFNELDLTIAEIARIHGCSTHPVGKELRRLGLRRKAKRRKGKGVGPDNPAWTGGRRIRKDGYVVIWTPSGEQLEHRFVMENHLGRKLRASEIVHHKDENKLNNQVSNLEIMTQRDHAQLHAPAMHKARYGK